MKFEKNNNYKSIAVYAFFALSSAILVFFLINEYEKTLGIIKTVLSPLSSLLIGVVIAYFLNPLLNFFERKVFKKVYQKNRFSKLRRGLSIFCVFAIVLFALFLFVMSFIPQLTESVNSLIENYGTVDKAIASINGFLKNNRFTAPHYDTIISTLMEYEQKIFNFLYSAIEKIAPLVINYTVDLMKGIYNVIIGIIFSIYILCYKEKLLALVKKLFTAFLSESRFSFIRKILGIT
ncbi:MAG: AI-2E family transporter, partial [Ruminococcaceae bacterium]|nr:AI-2E family transporter [Oscillospiraceae bacterium]